MPVVWQDAMSVGNLIIDDEHKYLFCLINGVELALKLDNNRAILKQLFEQLEEYTLSHFRQEEKTQLKMKYPGYIEHKMEHQRILEQMAALRQRVLESEPISAEEDLEVILEQETAKIDNYGEPGSGAAEPEPAESDSLNLDPQVQEQVVGLLRGWVLDHVLKTDMQMKKYLQRLPKNFL
ncbi:hypothetical protein DV711_09695 [Motiliproteus coralliicola]|uniref:Hemerythrin-like domain-containing protein n=2 Tax=Motiliproteus coralliicola TaxID=2283196 RepID=A0A369WL77_9GAMM|nr:hypothetical protein DV711_09695 [Motiliproteus coralliicola]